MGYPKDLLTPGEEIAFELKPHWKSLIPAMLIGTVILFATFFLYAKMNDFGMSDGAVSILRWVVLIAGLAAFGIFTLRHLVFWWSTEYVFTNRRVIIRSGFLRKVGRDMPLNKLNNISFSQSLTERMFHSGQLVIESAGEMGNLVIKDVPNIEAVQRETYSLMHADTGRFEAPAHAEPAPTAPAPAAPPPAPAQAPAQAPTPRASTQDFDPYVEGDTSMTPKED